jgi:tetratricopeptide (TPR) repeat protein
LTADPQGKVDPTANVVANFLRWIPEQEQIKRRLALDAALFSRPFNQDELEAFSCISEQERPSLYHWLTAQPFVQGNSQDGRYSYHQLAQELFSRHLYQQSPKEYLTSRRALAEYYQRLLKDIEAKEGKDVNASAQWLELTLALAKQLFLLSDEESHMKAIEQVINAKEFLRSEEFLQSVNYLFGKVAHEPSFSVELLAFIYFVRGRVHSALEKYEEALADFSRALELNPEEAAYYSNRSKAYFQLEKYEEALADYSRAIELNPEEADYYSDRGRAYRQLKKYEEALVDFNRALELDPELEWAYARRGLTYLWLRNEKQAIADYTSSWELNTTNVEIGWMGEWSRMCQERPEREMILRLEGVLKIDPQCYASRVCRGAMLWLQEQFEQSKIELEQAILLEQEHWGAYFWLGMVDISLRMYENAIASLEGALEKGLPPVLLTPLHWLAQERPDFYETHIVPLVARYNMFP